MHCVFLCLLYLVVSVKAFALATSAWAQVASERRIALVIGNSAYQHTARLKNSTNDANDIAAALKRLRFEVLEGVDLDKRSMERTIRQFGLKVAGAEIALFYYAGHGLQVGGQNYLLPTDARLSSEGDVDFEAVPLHLVLKQMEREAKTSLVLLDACRDNPLARNLARAMGTRSGQIAQGLAEVKVGVGTLIGFSTQPGNVSLDGDGLNSPYARALLNHMEAPNRDIGVTLVRVRNDVVKATHGKQVPWEHTSLMGQVVLNAITVPTSSVNYDKEMEIAFWNAVRDSQSAPRLQAYVDQYPTGTFAGLARTMIDELKRADEMRIRAESQRQAVELKAADDVRKAKEQAEQKLALATPLKTDGVPMGERLMKLS